MPLLPIFTSLFESSRMEQEEITIYITNAKLEGIVSVIHPAAVELRLPDGKRCVIAIDKIEAVSML